MATKLIKACKDLNIGMSTAVEFLKNIGQEIPSDPNARLDEEQYLLLAKQFNKDMALKIEAERQALERQRILNDYNKKNDTMSTIIDRESAYDAPWHELLNYVKDFWGVEHLVFEGTFTTEGVDLKYKRGIIKDVTINGKKVVLPLTNHPCDKISVRNDLEINEDLIPGPCRFSCVFVAPSLRRKLKEPFFLTIKPYTLRNINADGSEIVRVNEEECALMKRLRLDDHTLIGQFIPHGDNWIIVDIRNKDFTKIEDKERGVKDLSIYVNANWVKDVNKFVYYRFSWVLLETEPLRFGFDKKYPINPLSPNDIVTCLHDSIINYPTSASRKITRMLDTLNKQLTQSGKEVFIYELLQNANDYPQRDSSKCILPVDVEFHVTNEYLIFEHSGDYFNAKNIAAICDINDGEKSDNVDAIGYKGIGFKTVFLDNDYVLLQTGTYSFRFENSPLYPINTPWQILPVWTDKREIDSKVKQVFDRTDSKKFRVKFALRPRETSILSDLSRKDNYISLFNRVFESERVILFIPNICTVKIYFNNNEEPSIVRSKDSSQWCVSRAMVDDVPEEITNRINEVLEDSSAEKTDGYDKVPEKYKNFFKTSVRFACARHGRELLPVENTNLYCYLPAKKADWGFKFLMNTDMVPNGERDDIEDIKLNHEIAKIAGRQFFYWIKDLVVSKEYDLDSIFNLIPDFADCIIRKAGYKTFIEEFRDEFEGLIKSEPFVPCINRNGELVEATIYDVINDETRISVEGFLSETEFIEQSCTGCEHLPIKELRSSNAFHDFVYRYSPSNSFNLESLKKMCANDKFQEWLKNQDNNNKFLNFLLEKDYLKDFLEEDIFIAEECGDLYSADKLYYDIDEELKDLSAFSSHLRFLSFKTREFFKDNKKWEEIIDKHFAKFDSNNFIKNTLLNENLQKTLEALKVWDTSYHFYNFLAKNDVVPNNLCNLPFFNDEPEAIVIDNFNDKFVFISSIEGKDTCCASWLSGITISFISSNYNDDTLDFLKKNAGVKDFSHTIVVNDIILSEDYKKDVNEAQQVDINSSIDFVEYCFTQKDLFKTGSLCNYVLNASDCDGNEAFVLHKEHIYFPSTYFDKFSAKEWITFDWMYCLNASYLDISTNQNEIKKFLKSAFHVDELDNKSFYGDIVKKKISDIISNTSGDNDTDGTKNLDFISYLDENYRLIFEEEKDADLFKSFVFIKDVEGGYCDIDSNSVYVYAYNEELKNILDSEWFPCDTVNMCTINYGNSQAIVAIKAKNYDFREFFDDVITKELGNINTTIDSKESSIAFHSFIIDKLRYLTDTQKEVMRGAKVYLYGCDDPCSSSNGHKILSKSARELSEMGLVEFSDLDIIDPDYHIEHNEEYWKRYLENEQFTVLDFFKWLNENTDSFYETIEDKESNIKFWRWVKRCNLADKTLEDLPVLPIFLDTNEYTDSDEIIYLSDNYIEEGGLETIVKNYNPDALFISADYIEENDNIESWKVFWVKLDVRFEMVDILIDTIDNRLNETEDEKLPGTIVKYRSKLDEHYGGELISKLTTLRVKAHDGEFYSLAETIYIDCEKDEPFPYIVLPNQISFETAEQRKLIKEIINKIEGDCVETLSEWQQRKVDYYLEMQDSDCESIRDFHFKFIDDLSFIRNNARESLKEIENVENIYLLDRDNEFCKPSTLTMGSIYKPFFDFEECEINLEYISDSYMNECSEYTGRLFRTLKVHYDIQEEDLKFLENRDCAIYFWSKYLTSKEADISRVKDFIADKLLDNLTCIPTKDYMKKPCELYYGCEVSKYVKAVEDWENKIPIEVLPEIRLIDGTTIFGELPFKESLDFLDALYALVNIRGQEKRTQLLEWMIDDYNEDYDEKINEYREDEHAVWYNNKNELVQIKELYALEYGEKALEQYFGTNPRIINKAYFPTGDSFKEACDILKIQTITLEDLEILPVDKNEFSGRNTNHKLYALAFASSIDSTNWQELYTSYEEKLNDVIFYKCKSILIQYKDDTEISQPLKKFYHKRGETDFYFVKDLDDKLVYETYVKEFTSYLDIDEDDVPFDLAKIIMDSIESALEYIREQNSLMLDEAFKDALDEIIPGIKRELSGKEAEKDIEDIIGDYRPTFTTKENIDEDENEPQEQEYAEVEETSTDDETPEVGDGEVELEDTDDDDLVGVNNEVEIKNTTSNDTSRIGKREGESTPTIEDKIMPRQHKANTDYTDDILEHECADYVDRNDDDSWIEAHKPKHHPSLDASWKDKEIKQAELSVRDIDPNELEKICSYITTAKSEQEIIDEHYLVRYRLYNALVGKYNLDLNIQEKDFVISGKRNILTSDGKYIYARSAKGGILFISSWLWHKLRLQEGRICIYYGNRANDFELINSSEDLIKFVGKDNILIQISGEEKMSTIDSIFNGSMTFSKAHILIRIKSNEKYNSLFASTFSSNEENDTDF